MLPSPISAYWNLEKTASIDINTIYISKTNYYLGNENIDYCKSLSCCIAICLLKQLGFNHTFSLNLIATDGG